MLKIKELFLFLRAFLCVIGCISFVFNFATVNAQTKRLTGAKQTANLGGPLVTSTLVDSFVDADSNGRAAAGEEITYTATITNNGFLDAANVSFASSIDANSALVANSVKVQPDLSAYVIRCTFSTAGSGSGNCSTPSSAYGQTDSSNFTILGGQGSRLNVAASNVSYNSGSGVFSFDSTIQNLIGQSLGTIDNVTPEATGVRLFLNNSVVNAGTGMVSFTNADGSGTFSGINQPYFQFNQIIQPNQTSSAKTVQLNVPNTVNTFTLNFLVSAKAAAKLVINEVMVNPGGTITDANGEWFEVYNNGLFPVNMQTFQVGDSASSGDRPTHLINQSVIIQPQGYKVFGTTITTSINGGVLIDYAYGASMALGNAGPDAVRILSPYHVQPTAGNPTGNIIEIDRASYPPSSTVSALNGFSRELKNPNLDNSNMDDTNWDYPSTSSVYGPGGCGTPGAQNSVFASFTDPITGSIPPDNKLGQIKTNLAGTVSVNVGTITPGQSAVVTYRVTVANPIPAGVTQISNQGTITGDNFGTVMSDDPGTPAANDATGTMVGFAPTAALVNISGQVTDTMGRAVQGAQVVLFDSAETYTARTNSFGYYRISGITAGSTIVVNVNHKRYIFAPQVMSVSDSIANLNFTAENLY